jgi:ATP-dependent protease ClpP protease subunit
MRQSLYYFASQQFFILNLELEMSDYKNPFSVSDNEIKGALSAHRCIPIEGEITTASISEVIDVLIRFDFISNAPITLLINSMGGDCGPAFNLIDVINILHSPVDGLVLTNVGSAAVDILQGCHQRLALPHSRIWCHYVRYKMTLRSDLGELVSEAIKIAETDLSETEANVERLYSPRVNMEEYYKICRLTEAYNIDISATSAKKIGLIDEVVTDFKLFAPRHDPETKN